MRVLSIKQIVLAMLIVSLCLATANANLMGTDIQVDGNTYRYQFEAQIAAPFAATRAVVTDPDELKSINDSVIESRILETYADGTIKRKLLVEQCVLVFCFDLRFIEKVEAHGAQEIVATIIPEESNFRHGVATWQLEPIGEQRTRIRVVAEQEPDFWIPPVIGPAIIKRVFRKEIEETAKKIEFAAINRTVDNAIQ